MIVAGPETGFDISECGLVLAKIRLLRQIANGGAGLHKTAAVIGLDEASRDLE
jgi:hypothetical protein